MKLIADHLLAGADLNFLLVSNRETTNKMPETMFARYLGKISELDIHDEEGFDACIREMGRLRAEIDKLPPGRMIPAFFKRLVFSGKEILSLAREARAVVKELSHWQSIRAGLETMSRLAKERVDTIDNVQSELEIYECADEAARLKLLARTATRVRMSEVSSKYWESEMRVHDLPVVRPPWDLAWFEGECIGSKPLRYAVVMETTFDRDKSVGVTRAVPIVFNELGGTALWPPASVYFDQDGAFLNADFPPDMTDMEPLISSAFFAVTMLHAKNHVIRLEKPPDALSKKHRKKHGHPLLQYYTLDVEAAVKTLRADSGTSESEGSQGLRRAMHQCRGHFSDYRKGKGLFGRLKGLYWISEHTRGDVEEGTIVKDYQVKT